MKRLQYCYNCDKTQETVYKKVNEKFTVKNEEIIAEITINVCKACNEEIYDKNLEQENEKIVFSAYKRKKSTSS